MSRLPKQNPPSHRGRLMLRMQRETVGTQAVVSSYNRVDLRSELASVCNTPAALMDAGSAIDDRGASRRPLVRKRTSERSSAPTPPPLDVMLPPPPPRAPSFASCVPLEMEDPAHHGAPLPRGVPHLDAMRTSEPGRSRLDSSEPVDCESACLNLSRSEERSRPISAPAHPSARSLRPSQCRVHVVHARGQRRNVAGLHGRAGRDDRAHEGIVVERAP